MASAAEPRASFSLLHSRCLKVGLRLSSGPVAASALRDFLGFGSISRGKPVRFFLREPKRAQFLSSSIDCGARALDLLPHRLVALLGSREMIFRALSRLVMLFSHDLSFSTKKEGSGSAAARSFK
jgi:hypothetical protein